MIKVGIVITTYNLEKYISKALDSILEQQTSYDYKIFIADDCSQDNTISIIRKYKEKYNDKIELILSNKNLGSLKNSNRVFDHLECEYFSFLDGDDYWVGVDRLQKQIDFLNSHPQYMMCGGNTQYLRDGELKDFVIPQNLTNKTYSFSDLLVDKIPFIHTSSIMVRNSIFINGLPDCFLNAEDTFENCALRGEDFRRLLHLEKGPIYVMNDTISVYRIHSKGLWQSSSSVKKMIEHTISANFYKKYFGDKYGAYFNEKAKMAYRNLMRSFVSNYSIMEGYNLSAEETRLFTSLLNDLSIHNSLPCEEQHKFRNKIRRILLKLFF